MKYTLKIITYLFVIIFFFSSLAFASEDLQDPCKVFIDLKENSTTVREPTTAEFSECLHSESQRVLNDEYGNLSPLFIFTLLSLAVLFYFGWQILRDRQPLRFIVRIIAFLLPIFSLVGIFFYLVGRFHYPIMLSAWDCYFTMFLYAVPIAFIACTSLLFLFRRSAIVLFMPVLMKSQFYILFFFAILYLVMAFFTFGNGAFDDAPEHTIAGLAQKSFLIQPASALRGNVKINDHWSCYVSNFLSITDDQKQLLNIRSIQTIRIPKFVEDEIKDGDNVIWVTKPGFFGVEWLVRIEKKVCPAVTEVLSSPECVTKIVCAGKFCSDA